MNQILNQTIMCSFSTLDDLPRTKRRDGRAVLEILHHQGRFSVFEATEFQSLAVTLDTLSRLQLFQYVKNEESEYPWCVVKLTDRGAKFLQLETTFPKVTWHANSRGRSVQDRPACVREQCFACAVEEALGSPPT